MAFKVYAELGPQTIDLYDAINDTTGTATIPTLVAGSIDQATPDTNDTLTVSGSNGTEFAEYQWQRADTVGGTYSDVSGATASSFSPTTAGFYQRGVKDGAQPFDYTDPVEVTTGTSYAETLFDVGGSLGFTTIPSGPYYTDVAGTTPATDGDSVAKWTDLGTDTDIAQSDPADRPTLRDPGGGVTPYLEFAEAHELITSTQGFDQGTLAIRFKSLDGTTQSGGLAAQAGSDLVEVFAASGQTQFRLGSTIAAPSTDLIADQNAHTIALTWDNTAKVFTRYIDGVQLSPSNQSFSGDANPAADFIINRFARAGAFFATLVLNRRLTETEIANLDSQQWDNYT